MVSRSAEQQVRNSAEKRRSQIWAYSEPRLSSLTGWPVLVSNILIKVPWELAVANSDEFSDMAIWDMSDL